MAMVGKGIIDLELGTSKLGPGASRVGRAMSKLGGAVKVGIMGATVAVGALTLALRKAAQAAAIQEKAEAKLAAVQRATGNATGYTTKQLYAQAAALQKVTTYGDEVIISGQAILATFKQIKGDVFIHATEAMLDMATVLETDLRSAAVQLGKALNDPILGVTALNRAGIQFSEQQRDVIRSLQESGRMYDAQAMILREIESQMKGVARAQADTFSGRRTQAANRWSDAMERIGSAFEPAFAKAVETLEALGTAAERNAIGFATWADKIGSVVEALAKLPDERERAAAGLSWWAKMQAGTGLAKTMIGGLLESHPLSAGVGKLLTGAGRTNLERSEMFREEAEYLQEEAAKERHRARQPAAPGLPPLRGPTFTGRLRGMLGWAGGAGRGGMQGLAGMMAEAMGGGIVGMQAPGGSRLGGFEGGAGMWQRLATAGAQATDPAMRAARAQEAALEDYKRMIVLLERIAEGKPTVLFGGIQGAISGFFGPKTPPAKGE